MTQTASRTNGFRRHAQIALAIALGAMLPANGQMLSLIDPHPFGETGRPMGIAGSAFEVWVAYPGTLLQFRRMGEDAPKWFGNAQGLPSEGISHICYDDPTQSLWIKSSTGRWLRWSAGLGSAREESPPLAGCSSRIGKTLDVSTIANLIPTSPGWLRMGSDFIDPRGVRQHIQQAITLDDRELWLATDAGIWSGRSMTGRVDPRPAGLAENCAVRLSPDSSGAVWLQGCQGSYTALVDESPRATFLVTDPRNSDLRASRVVGASATRGVWVSVADGLLKLSVDGISDRYLGRKAPFGGRVLTALEINDTLWVGTQNSLGYRYRGKQFFTDAPPMESPGPINALHSTPLGVLAATNDGFWLKSSSGWIRPPWLRSAQRHQIVRSAVEPREPFRVGWWDGRQVRIDTLPGHGGNTDLWLPDRTPLRSMRFDTEGRLHLALNGTWVIWNLTTSEKREWNAGLGLSGDVYDVLPGSERAILAGEGGGASVQIPSYAPPSSMSK